MTAGNWGTPSITNRMVPVAALGVTLALMVVVPYVLGLLEVTTAVELEFGAGAVFSCTRAPLPVMVPVIPEMAEP